MTADRIISWPLGPTFRIHRHRRGVTVTLWEGTIHKVSRQHAAHLLKNLRAALLSR
jgi:hypothetical protein